MANDKRISALTERTSFSANDFMVLDNAGEAESKKFMASMLTDQFRDMQNILGSKNMLVNKLSTTAISGITYTVNSDGSITFTGQATADVSIVLCYRQGISSNPKIFLPNGDYYLSGITGGSASSISMQVGVTKSGSFTNVGTNYNGSSLFTIDGDDGSAVGANPQVQIDIKSGTSFATPKTVYPMIRPASILDATYVPYVETNKQLQDDVASLNSALSDKGNYMNLAKSATTGWTTKSNIPDLSKYKLILFYLQKVSDEQIYGSLVIPYEVLKSHNSTSKYVSFATYNESTHQYGAIHYISDTSIAVYCANANYEVFVQGII